MAAWCKVFDNRMFTRPCPQAIGLAQRGGACLGHLRLG
jgi:hypothetical protein